MCIYIYVYVTCKFKYMIYILSVMVVKYISIRIFLGLSIQNRKGLFWILFSPTEPSDFVCFNETSCFLLLNEVRSKAELRLVYSTYSIDKDSHMSTYCLINMNSLEKTQERHKQPWQHEFQERPPVVRSFTLRVAPRHQHHDRASDAMGKTNWAFRWMTILYGCFQK